MDALVTCPNCTRNCRVSDASSGKNCLCPSCHRSFYVAPFAQPISANSTPTLTRKSGWPPKPALLTLAIFGTVILVVLIGFLATHFGPSQPAAGTLPPMQTVTMRPTPPETVSPRGLNDLEDEKAQPQSGVKEIAREAPPGFDAKDPEKTLQSLAAAFLKLGEPPSIPDNSLAQQKAYAEYVKAMDAIGNSIVGKNIEWSLSVDTVEGLTGSGHASISLQTVGNANIAPLPGLNPKLTALVVCSHIKDNQGLAPQDLPGTRPGRPLVPFDLPEAAWVVKLRRGDGMKLTGQIAWLHTKRQYWMPSRVVVGIEHYTLTPVESAAKH